MVKGGPGTGKSRFIKSVAAYAAEKGWDAEYYYCSSDPESLDGVLLKRRDETAAVIDGTPPHPWEPELPGLREEIINLGQFWRSEIIKSHQDEIHKLNAEKSLLWRRAYRWLAGCLDMCDVIRDIGASYANTEKILEQAQAILAELPDGEGASVRTALVGSVGMLGVVRSSEFCGSASRLWMVRDCNMSAHLLIRALLGEATRKGLKVRVSYDPIDSSRPDAIFAGEGEQSVAVVVGDETPDRDFLTIDMAELTEPPEKRDAALAEHAERCRTAMLAGAVDSLAEIRKCHFRLEEIYTAAMDFDAVNSYTSEFCVKYFG